MTHVTVATVNTFIEWNEREMHLKSLVSYVQWTISYFPY